MVRIRGFRIRADGRRFVSCLYVTSDGNNEANVMRTMSDQATPLRAGRVYHPNMLKTMRLALDLACARLSAYSKEETARTQLALQILRGAEPPNPDPDRLASFAIEQLLLGSLQAA